MKPIVKRLIHYTYRPWLMWYLRKDRSWRIDGLHIRVKKGVFHPRFFFSSSLLLNHLKQTFPDGMREKNVLDLGCGSGILALWCARAGAHTLGVDINPLAVACTLENARQNNLELQVLHSDLLQNVPPQTFDLILINPPYYQKKPVKAEDHAWYCGNDFEYFHRLFKDLKPYTHNATRIWMSLSEDTAIAHIQQVAMNNGWQMNIEVDRKTGWERHYVFSLLSPFGALA